jgi:glycine/D-amino acid oxidase-like deaminating enzyme
MSTPPSLPQHARVVVVGGGIIGTSTAYHLALMGWKDIVLLERHQLTAGTTWHAAGLMVAFGSTSETSTNLRKYTRDLYSRLEAETGQATGFMPIGFIEVASDKDRLEEYRRVSAFNRYCGIDVHELSPREVEALFPLARVDDIEAGFYVKEDGRVNPVDVTMALGKGAKLRGVKIFEGVPATGVLQKGGRVTGVCTPFGDIKTDFVVNCTGMWAREFGATSGVSLSNQAAEHYYLITEPIKDLPRNMPVLEDPGCYGYYREEGGGLMVGLFEPVCAPWKVEGIPTDFSFGDLPPDWERMTPYLEKAMSRVPITTQVGIKKFFCGPESFTPDLLPIVGEAPNLRGYFVAAGLNSIGILTGGGLGRVMAHWIIKPGLSPRAHGRVARHGLQVPLPGEVARDGARRATVAVSRSTGRAGSVFHRDQRLGNARLVCGRGQGRRPRSSFLGPPGLVAELGGRTSRRTRERHRHGHVVHGEIPGAGPRRRPVPESHLGQRRRRRGGHGYLHAMAERAGQARSRPDRDQAR